MVDWNVLGRYAPCTPEGPLVGVSESACLHRAMTTLRRALGPMNLRESSNATLATPPQRDDLISHMVLCWSVIICHAPRVPYSCQIAASLRRGSGTLVYHCNFPRQTHRHRSM